MGQMRPARADRQQPSSQLVLLGSHSNLSKVEVLELLRISHQVSLINISGYRGVTGNEEVDKIVWRGASDGTCWGCSLEYHFRLLRRRWFPGKA